MHADTAPDLAQSLAGGHQPPRKPPVAASDAAPPRRPEFETIRFRSFGTMPARLSPVKRGEIRIGRPPALIGSGEAAFAFYPPDSQLAPMLRDRDLVYAVTGTPDVDDLIVVIDCTGRAGLGVLAEPFESRLTLKQGNLTRVYEWDEVAEIGVIRIIHRDGHPRVVVMPESD